MRTYLASETPDYTAATTVVKHSDGSTTVYVAGDVIPPEFTRNPPPPPVPVPPVV